MSADDDRTDGRTEDGQRTATGRARRDGRYIYFLGFKYDIGTKILMSKKYRPGGGVSGHAQ